MKRIAYVIGFVMLTGHVWSAVVDDFRIKHPVSGREVTVPGKNGANAMLMTGWKTTPAGRHLPSGDMILSGQVSPDGALLAFTNTGYTHHALHIVDLGIPPILRPHRIGQDHLQRAFRRGVSERVVGLHDVGEREPVGDQFRRLQLPGL